MRVREEPHDSAARETHQNGAGAPKSPGGIPEPQPGQKNAPRADSRPGATKPGNRPEKPTRTAQERRSPGGIPRPQPGQKNAPRADSRPGATVGRERRPAEQTAEARGSGRRTRPRREGAGNRAAGQLDGLSPPTGRDNPAPPRRTSARAQRRVAHRPTLRARAVDNPARENR